MNGKLAYNFFFLFRADFLTGFVKGKRLKAIVGIRSDNTILFQNGISLLFERFRFLVQCPEPLFKVVCLLLYFVNFAAQTQNNLTILKHNVKIVQTNLTYNSTIKIKKQIPGFALWGAAYPICHREQRRQRERLLPLIDAKYDEAAQTAKKAKKLL